MIVLGENTLSGAETAERLPFGADLFPRARERLDRDEDAYLLCRFPGEERETVLAREKDIILYGLVTVINQVPVYTNYPGGSLRPIADTLDLTLLAGYDAYWFEALEEYTWAIADLVLFLWPEKAVWFCDERALALWPGGEVRCGTVSALREQTPSAQILHVPADRQYMLCDTRGESKLQSQQVMLSLCWCRNVRHMGEKNKGKTVLVIDISSRSAGMGDLVKAVQSYAAAARRRGWIPVAHVYDTQYSDSAEEELWTELFEPLSDVTLEEALQSDRVILGRDNGMGKAWAGLEYVFNPYCMEYYTRPAPLLLAPALRECFAQRRPAELSEEKTLGILARGTDMARILGVDCAWKECADMARLMKDSYGCETVFLATEDADCLRVFQDAFGESLLYVEQERVRDYNARPGFTLIADILAGERGSRLAWGRKYLYIAWCLGRCKNIRYTISSGTLYLAQSMRLGEGKKEAACAQMDADAAAVMSNTELVGRLREAPEALVYGAGQNGRLLSLWLRGSACRLVFFDRRAESERLTVFGEAVLAPGELRRYPDAPVVVTPYWGREQIVDDLREMGVEPERMLFFQM